MTPMTLGVTVAQSLDMLAAQDIGLGGAGLELLLDRQGAGDGLAYASAAAYDVLLADVDRHDATVLLAYERRSRYQIAALDEQARRRILDLARSTVS
jgi:hypothetical protein